MSKPTAATDSPRKPRRSRAGLVAAVLTYLGVAFLALVGVSLLLGARDGKFFGLPTPQFWLAGIPVPVESGLAVGALLIALAIALVALTVLTRRGHRMGLLGLTVIGVIVIARLLYAAATTDPISPLPPAAWIALILVLSWVGRPRGTRP